MKLLAYLFRNSPYIVLLAMISAFMSGLCNASLITLVHLALENSGQFNELGWQFMGLAIFSLITAVVSSILLSYLYRRAVFDWQIHLSREILKSPLRQLEELGNEELLTVLLKDVTTIGSSLLPMLPLCTNVVVVSLCLGYLCWLSWRMFLGMLVFILLGALTYKIVLERGHVTLRLAREEARELYGFFRAMTDGIKELKLHHHRRYAFFEESLKPTAASIQQRFFRWSLFYSLTQAWTKFLLLFVIGLILFVFPSLISVDSQILTGYILTLLYIRSMLFSIMSAFPALANADIAFQKINELGFNLNVEVEEDVLPSLKKDNISWRSIEFVDITHSYYREREDSHFTLGPINFSLKPGELVFLVGENGSGKTTLAKLITGLYIPESGSVRLDGKLISDDNREYYRQLFSVVFADFQLFNNLLGLGMPHLDYQAKDYLVKLQLDHKVKIRNGKLSTTALSFGQRQRLALLTAYLEDRPIYIFDEWASNQDPVFKDLFYMEFLPELKAKGKTILVISHDQEYFHVGDRTLKLEYSQLDNVASLSL